MPYIRHRPDRMPRAYSGFLWWRDYSVLLRHVGLLKNNLCGETPRTSAFDDDVNRSALQRLLQASIFSKRDFEESLFFFASISILNNDVGLLDGIYFYIENEIRIQQFTRHIPLLVEGCRLSHRWHRISTLLDAY